MQKNIQSDLYRYGGLTGSKGFLKGLRIPGFRYTYLLRKASTYKKYTPGWFFYSFLLNRYAYKYGFQIPSRTSIGEGFYIGHYGFVVINEKARIGRNCTIGPGVTIGQANRGKLKGYPTIGDNVWIGTNAVIVGNVRIGSNVLIAPNAFVNQDIPGSSMVIGNPCQIIPKENPCESYINFVLEPETIV
ncbi:MAG: serine acetyltransferase [Niastella sp.]|nr:serine acetyltransferase [Niastella sp.]